MNIYLYSSCKMICFMLTVIFHRLDCFSDLWTSYGCQFLDIISLVCFISFIVCAYLFLFIAVWICVVNLLDVVCVSCSKHLLDQEDVDMVNPLDKEKGVTVEDFKLIKMHMSNCMLSFYTSLCISLIFMLNRGFGTMQFMFLN